MSRLKHLNAVFQLNEKQASRFEEWKSSIERAIVAEHGEDVFEEDCCLSSPYAFAFRDMGIATSVIVTCGENKLDLSLDDDGEFLAPVV